MVESGYELGVLVAGVLGAWLAGPMLAAATEPAPGAAGKDPGVTAEALKLHRSCLVVDGHNDLPWIIRKNAGGDLDKMNIAQSQPAAQTDIPRLLVGGIGAQFWAAYVPSAPMDGKCPTALVLEQIDLICRMAARYPDVFEMAYTADDIELIHGRGKIACLIGVEGGHVIAESLGTLRMLNALGARYMTLTHGETNSWCDSATDEPRHGGLSSFGEEVVREMNRLGMMVDISHVSVQAMEDALRVSTAPIIATHSGADGVAAHPRNVPDEVLRRMADRGGVVMVNFFSGYVHPEGAKVMRDVFRVDREMRAKYPKEADYKKAREQWKQQHPYPRGTVQNLVDHIDHIVQVAGIDHVGLGADYDGVSELPEGLEDVSGYPRITQALLDRGYKPEDIRKILGGNLLRIMREVERGKRKD